MRYVLPKQLTYMTDAEKDALYESFVCGGKRITYFLISNPYGKISNAISIDGYTVFTDCRSKEEARRAITDFIMTLRLAYPVKDIVLQDSLQNKSKGVK